MSAIKININKTEEINASDATTTKTTTETKNEKNKSKNKNCCNLKILLFSIIFFLILVISGFILYFKKPKEEKILILSNIYGISDFYEDVSYNLIKYYGNYTSDPDVQQGCLQRKLIIDKEGNQKDIVKTEDICINNMYNKWHIRRRGEDHISIISDYDSKCLNYSKDKLYMKECKDNNKSELFILKNGDSSCEQMNETKCLDLNIISIPLESKKYKNLKCSRNLAQMGVKCCSETTKVEYVDEIGNWGIENNELCGIGYTRCSFETLGYHCCTSVNPKVVRTDENGSWGYEDDEYCGIGEVANSKYRIRNKKTSQCLLTDKTNTDKIILGDCDDTDYSLWNFKKYVLISPINSKCINPINSVEPSLNDCKKVNNLILYDSEHICIYSERNPEPLCLNGTNLKFESLNGENFEWIAENLNNKLIYSIEDVVRKNPDLQLSKFRNEF